MALRLLRSSRFALTQPDRFATGASRSAWLATNREPRLRGGYVTLSLCVSVLKLSREWLVVGMGEAVA